MRVARARTFFHHSRNKRRNDQKVFMDRGKGYTKEKMTPKTIFNLFLLGDLYILNHPEWPLNCYSAKYTGLPNGKKLKIFQASLFLHIYNFYTFAQSLITYIPKLKCTFVDMSLIA